MIILVLLHLPPLLNELIQESLVVLSTTRRVLLVVSKDEPLLQDLAVFILEAAQAVTKIDADDKRLPGLPPLGLAVPCMISRPARWGARYMLACILFLSPGDGSRLSTIFRLYEPSFATV